MFVEHSLFQKTAHVPTGAATEIHDEDPTTSFSSTDPDFNTSSSISTNQIGSTTTTATWTTPGEAEESDKKKWVLPLIISLACFLLITALTLGLVIYRKRNCFGLSLPCLRKRIQFTRPISKITDSVRSSIISSTFSSIGKSVRKYNTRLVDNYAVKVVPLRDNVDAEKRGICGVANNLDWIMENDFSLEFDELKKLDLKELPTTVALKAENFQKNRFSNVLPYDRTRVLLTAAGPPGTTSDYVNASYVGGFRKEREFICTQGPLKRTVADFWEMCWETGAVAIVMLTKCYEKSQEKCYPYWPAGGGSTLGSSTFGGIRVTLEKQVAWKVDGVEGNKEHVWLVSYLSMEKGEGEEENARKILHVAFLSWPDFGVVDPPSCLVRFVEHVQQLLRGEGNEEGNGTENWRGPVVVHCSAGVGRSGVFIAVDQIIRRLEALLEKNGGDSNNGRGVVNVFEMVVKMRRERMGMVQNPVQYALIYKCLHYLVGRHKEDGKPTMIDTALIQGSDWGLYNPDA